MVTAELFGNEVGADLHLLLQWARKELLGLVEDVLCLSHVEALLGLVMEAVKQNMLLTWLTMVKKPIFLDALRTCSASACRSSSQSLYMGETSIRGIESEVVAALDSTIKDLPL